MKINKLVLVIGFIVAFSLMFELIAHADSWDLATTITFSRPIRIPGRALPAGTYLFKLVNEDAGHTVQILNAEGTVVYATVQTIPAERQQPTDDTAVTLAEAGG